MNILFVHQNMPGQFKHLAPLLARDPKNRVVFLTARKNVEMPGVATVTYETPRGAAAETHPYVRKLENAARYGQQVLRACFELGRGGFAPDFIIAHPGWGEALYLKDVFPRARLINFCEFYYRGTGADVGFDPEAPVTIDTICRARTRNAGMLLSLESCDAGVSPTQWQKSVHPAAFHDRISVIFDGIDPEAAKPDPKAYLTIGSKTFRKGDRVVTYVARNLEPYRGYRTFVRAIPDILAADPATQILVVGDEQVSYGTAPEAFKSWREAMDAEVQYDRSRVYFLGHVPYKTYLKVLQVSAAHIYLTYPFVLSWSFVEAMAAGALIVASDTAPVREFMKDGETGLLTDFFDAKLLARRVNEALDRQDMHAPMRQAARDVVLENYTVEKCLPQWITLIDRIKASS